MAAKEYLDKAGLKRLVELIKGELAKVETQKGDDGKSIHFIDSGGAELPVGFSDTLPLGDSGLPEDLASCKAGDLIITDMGYIIKITELTDTTITISIPANLKGEKGKDGTNGTNGYSILYSSANFEDVTAGQDYTFSSSFKGFESCREGDIGITHDGVLVTFKRFEIPGGYGYFYYAYKVAKLKGTDGANGRSIVYATGAVHISGTDYATIENASFNSDYKEGDLMITEYGDLFELVMYKPTYGNAYMRGQYLATLKGKDGKDGSVLPSIIDNGTKATPHLDINFGKPNETRKAFFEQSLLLGTTHYGDGFIQDKNGNRMLMPALSQNETMATERELEAVKEKTNTKFGYYSKTGADKYEIKCNGLYIIFGNNSDLKLCKSDGTEIVSGAQEIMFMTTPYNGVKSGNVFVAMGMYVYKGTLSVMNLKIPVEGLQAELDDGSYITAGEADSLIYISEMVK